MPSTNDFMSTLRQYGLVALLGGVLTACGGGGGGGSDPRTGSGGSSGGGSTSGGSGTTGEVKIGNGTGAGFSQGVAAASSTTLQAGASTTISINLVDENNAAVTDDFTIEFTSNCVANGLASFDQSSVATSSGLASSVYTASGCSGDDAVTVSTNVDGTDIQATVTLDIEADEVLAVEFVSIASPQLSLAGIGGQETTQVTFKLVGEQSAPIIGEQVSFAVSTTVGGITLAQGTDSAVTDNQGNVTTVVQSGTVATSVNVTATHDATGIQGISDNISISTGIPVQSRFTLSAEVFNPPEAFSVNGVEVDLSIIASDQFGNDVPDGTRISFVSPESGNVDSSCMIVSGECSVTWRSSSPRPADMRFTIIAYTSGAEDFDDLNGNNVFDNSDSFSLASQDLTEAFADENEDGEYDLGEFFVDFGANGEFDDAEDFTDSNGNGTFDDGEPYTDANSNGIYDFAEPFTDSNGNGQHDAGEPFQDIAGNNGVFDSGDGVWNGPCMSGINASALCPGSDSVVIFETLDIVMPFNAARIYDLGTFPATGSIINIVSGTSVSLGNLVLADSNNNPNFISGGVTFTGNSLPAGTDIAFSIVNAANGVDVNLFGGTTWEIDADTTLPNGFFGATIIADPDSDPGSAILELKVTFPDNTVQSFLWNLNITL